MTYVIFIGGCYIQKKHFFIKLFMIGLLTSIILANPTIVILAETTEPETLENVEIREYEGKDLSSIDDFFENSIKGPQYINGENYTLTVTGLVNNELQLTYNKAINGYNHYEKIVTLNCVEGWSVTLLWEGILIKDLIATAGVNTNATTVIFYAYDGYSTSLPLNYIIDNNIMIAYKMNNVTLPPERGYPFQLVAESKWGYKWIKWIVAIELSDNPDYRGYWEMRGYSNNADLGASFFEPTGIPEFPSLTIIPLLIAIATIVVIAYRKRLPKEKMH